eukprot:TRINITY_DN6078_c0_g1_i6.p1 TRINITY_DN6078_c0_g1~~TRINITY_DN6078_c0_g1_i6.p1  ORF type:complete len:216 (+),score=59.36 TRINITY_DN6078_c0_g1_i6:175-822(+)
MAHQPFPGVLLAIALVPCVLAVSAHGDSGLSAGRSHRSEPHAFQVQTLEAGDTELAPENGEGEEEGGEEEFGPRARGGWVQNQAARSKAEVERGAMDRHAPRGGRLMDPAPEKVWLKKLGQAGFLPSDETKSIRDNQGRYNTIGACQDKCLDDFGEDCLAVEWEGTDCRTCLLYTSDAADEEDSVDLGGRRIIKKKKKKRYNIQTNELNKKDTNK